MTPVELWVQALRSGSYLQGQQFLHRKTEDGDRFCCLGVACDIYQREVGDLTVTEERGGVVLYYDDNNQSYEAARHLPEVVRNWLGLRTVQGGFPNMIRVNGFDGERPVWGLAAANDAGADFYTIADIIESRPEGLFRD